MAIEFVVDQTALDVVRNTVINANFDAVKADLTEMVKPYQNMIVSADAISSAKADRAKIRKVADNIDSYRKTVKKVYSEPLAAFEAKCKELTGICKTASDNLDGQIKGFEEEIRQQKIAGLKAYFDQHEKKHPGYAVWERIYDPKWGNATSREDAAKEIIDNYIAAIDSDVDAILAMESGYDEYLLKEYKNGKTVSQVIAICQQMKRAEEEKKRREAELKRMKEEMMTRVAETEKRKYEPIPEAEDIDSDLSMVRRTVVPPTEPQEGEMTEPLHTVNLWVRGTRDQLAALSELFHQAGVEYGAL